MSAAAILTLVRHGQTSANLEGVWHGSIDTALTPDGVEQASRVAGYLRERHADASAIYCSPLQRARHTAEAIDAALGLGLRVEPEISEFDLGRWEGKTYRELHDRERLWHHMRDDPDYAPHGGESPRQVAERFSRALERIAAQHRGERVIVVSHGGALTIALGALIDGDYSQWRRVMDNCAVSELTFEPPRLLSFNHTGHLEPTDDSQ